MIDVHSHIVFGVDDGSRTIDESIEIIKEAYNAGFRKIIATPHYMEGYYEKDVYEINKKISEIKVRLHEIHCDVQILQGNEIYITENITKLLENKKATSLNSQQYVLFELPLNAEAMNFNSVVYQILEVGGTPVLAHPERYPFVQSNPNVLLKLIENGVLIQSNYGSIIGQYKKESQITLKKMLEHRMVHLLGSDVHVARNIYPKIGRCIEEMRKIVEDDYIDLITTINPQKIINGEEIEDIEPIPIKESFFNKLFQR